MKIKFTKQSIEDIDNIYKCIQERNDKNIARKVIHQIKDVIDNLGLYKHLGVKVKKSIRRVVIPGLPFAIVYKIDKQNKIIYILTVFHTARRF